MSGGNKEDTPPESERVHDFLRHIALERRLSQYTVRNYSKGIQGFFEWLREDGAWAGDMEAISDRQVRSFLIEKQRDLSRRTLHNHVSALRTFFKYLRARNFVCQNPFQGIVLPKLNRSLPKFLTEKQMGLFLSGPMRLLDREVIEPAIAWRDRLVLELLYGAGLRVSELVSLNYGNIDFQEGVARVLGKGQKERLCPLGRTAMVCLGKFKAVFAPDTRYEAPVLPNNRSLITSASKVRKPKPSIPVGRLSVRQVQLMIKKYLALADLPQDLSPHKIRHSYATHLLNRGADIRLVQELLGHASLSTTQIYTHVGVTRLKQTHAQAHPRG